MTCFIDRAWVTRSRETAPEGETRIVDTDLWSLAYAGDGAAAAWLGLTDPVHRILTSTTMAEMAFGVWWYRRLDDADQSYCTGVLEHLAELSRTYPVLPLADPELISDIARMRADARLRNLWMNDARAGRPRSAGRIEVAAASRYLGVPIATRGRKAYELIVACGYELPGFDDPTGGAIGAEH